MRFSARLRLHDEKKYHAFRAYLALVQEKKRSGPGFHFEFAPEEMRGGG
jgi:hypothetical protein